MITYNIQPNLNAWTNHTFVLAERCSNLGNAYQCTTGGTSTSGPTGTGSSINNGGVAVFKWLSAIDYVSLAAWSNAIVTAYSSSGLPDNLTALVWNNGVISVPNASTSLLALYSTSNNGHTVLITAAAGESFRDKGAALSWNASNGVAFDIASGSATANQYIYIDSSMQNVTISGLQFRDTNAPGTDAWIMINMESTNSVVQDCIFDGYDHFYTGANNVGLVNCVVVNRCTTPLTGAWPVKWDTTATGAYVEGCVFIATGGGGGPGSFITGLSSTAATGIARNCGFFGASSPINSQNITGMWAVDHCIFDVTAAAALDAPANGFPSTNGTGNLFSATIANQFISATTDFRPKVGATTINAGVVDTTHNPAGDDIFRVARGAVWDIGAAEYNSLAASVALAIFHPVVVATASLSVHSAHAAVALPPLKAVATAAREFSARVSVALAVHAVAFTGQSNQASCAAFLGERPESKDFSPDFGPDTFFYVVANAIIGLNATAAVNLPPLSAVGFLNDVAAGSSAIPAIACVAGATAIGAANAIGLGSVTLAAVASMSSLTTAVGSAAIIIQPLMSAGQTDNGSATVSFGSMLASAHAAGFDQASAAVAILTIVATGVIGFSCSGTVSLPALAVVASATLAGQAIGLATLPPIRTPDAVRPELQADPSAGIFLLADGSGLILRADVPRARMLSESTNTSGTATIPSLVCVGLAFDSDIATSTRNVLIMAAVGTLGQADMAAGSASIMLAASSQAVQQRATNALATLESLQAVVTAGQSDVVTSTVTLPPVAAVGAAGQVDQAHSATNVNLGVVANGGPTLIWSGIVSLPRLASVSTAGNFNGAMAAGHINLTAAAVLASSANASAVDTFATMAVAASGMLTTPASVTVAIPALAIVAAAGQSDIASGSAFVSLQCISTVNNLSVNANATAAVLPLVAVGVLNNAVVNASTLVAVPPLVAVGTAQNFVLSASVLASIRFGVAAAASINSAQMAGSGTIVISAASATGQANFAATLASLAVLAETNATLYVSPIAYEPGIDIVYWSA